MVIAFKEAVVSPSLHQTKRIADKMFTFQFPMNTNERQGGFDDEHDDDRT